MGCATSPQRVPVGIPVADTNCRVEYDHGEKMFHCGNIRYDLEGPVLGEKVERFGPAIPATITQQRSVRVGRQDFRYTTEIWAGEGHPHTVWLETPGGKYKFEIDRGGKVWGVEKLVSD